METPTFLFLVFLITSAAAGEGAGAEIRNLTIYGTVGSSVIFPAVDITDDTVYDFKKGYHFLYTYHGSGNVRPPYRQRAEFDSKLGTFELRSLTEEDSGVYEQVVDMKRVAVIYLHVIEPLKQPTLRMNKTINGNQSSIVLECSVQGPGIRNITFLKDGEDIPKSISRMDHMGHLTLDACDPGSSGKYTCTVWNVLDNKTSPEVIVTRDEYDCKNQAEHVENGSTGLTVTAIAISIIGCITVILGVVFFVHRRRKADVKRLRCGCEDQESGNTSQEKTQLDVSSGEEPRKEFYQPVPINDPAESGDEVKVNLGPRLSTEEDKDPQLPTEENSQHRLLPGHRGQDGKTPMELEVDGSASDHGRVANG